MYDGRNILIKAEVMIEQILHKEIDKCLKDLYSLENQDIQLQKTRKEFEGDITLVVFPILKFSQKDIQETSQEIGNFLLKSLNEISDFNIVNGFINFSISSDFWFSQFIKSYTSDDFGIVKADINDPSYLVEYSSPNTNKPIHLGHLRNNFLGFAVAEILKASGKNVKKVQIINDRGIHICKSMVAWQDYGNGETPESSGIKGDHFVGKYYVQFEQKYKEQIDELIASGIEESQARKEAPILRKAQQMLIKWEDKDDKVIAIWNRMNQWVLDGFEATYKKLGVDFDKNYYESDTYLLGKKVVEIGIKQDVFYHKEDESVWVDLSDDGLDKKIILRADGTAVYITQDIGTAIQRHDDFSFSHMIYTVANEQDYHFKVLFLILDKLGYDWARNCHHLSYGMVDLPSGKMKSREGTVVDADEFIDEMIETAKSISQQKSQLDDLTEDEKDNLYEIVGLGALKYFLLKVDPKKRMLFDPIESIDFNGNTGPFIQYTYARIQSLVRKYHGEITNINLVEICNEEKHLIKKIIDFPSIIQESANNYSPSVISNYIYNLVKEYNSYYQNIPILNTEDDDIITFRVALSEMTGRVIKSAMRLLGISVPNRM